MPKANTRVITVKLSLALLSVMLTPLTAGVIAQTTNSSPDSGICITAQWESDPSIFSHYGDCPVEMDDSPLPSLPTVEPTASEPAEPEWAPSESPAPLPEPEPEPEPEIDEPDEIIPPAAPAPTPGPTVKPPPSPVTPVENLNPNTKKFKFCHGGSMHSNNYNGMINGHKNHSGDIMPPIPTKNYPGWNWSSKTAQTFYNNCITVNN